MATIGTIGNKLDLLFRQGSTFGPYEITIKDNNQSPINLTGYTFNAAIKKSYSASTSIASIVVSPVDLINGKISINIPANITATIKGNPDKEPQYIWDMEYINTNGSVEPLLYGSVTSFANV